MVNQNDPLRNWQLYILLASDNSLYTGITTDVQRRFDQHARGRGAKYFRGRQPLQIVHLEAGFSRSAAAKREAEIKAMSRREKERLIGATVDPSAQPGK